MHVVGNDDGKINMPLLGMGIKQAVSYEGIMQCMSGIEEFHVDE
jgi:hypothetical protein